jgi:hypothetical protein
MFSQGMHYLTNKKLTQFRISIYLLNCKLIFLIIQFFQCFICQINRLSTEVYSNHIAIYFLIKTLNFSCNSSMFIKTIKSLFPILKRYLTTALTRNCFIFNDIFTLFWIRAIVEIYYYHNMFFNFFVLFTFS